jgi:hypothetical protein
MKHVFAKASDHFVEGTATSVAPTGETSAGALSNPASEGLGLSSRTTGRSDG